MPNKKIVVKFEFLIKEEATNNEIFDWLYYQLGATPEIVLSNPLEQKELKVGVNNIQIQVIR